MSFDTSAFQQTMGEFTATMTINKTYSGFKIGLDKDGFTVYAVILSDTKGIDYSETWLQEQLDNEGFHGLMVNQTVHKEIIRILRNKHSGRVKIGLKMDSEVELFISKDGAFVSLRIISARGGQQTSVNQVISILKDYKIELELINIKAVIGLIEKSKYIEPGGVVETVITQAITLERKTSDIVDGDISAPILIQSDMSGSLGCSSTHIKIACNDDVLAMVMTIKQDIKARHKVLKRKLSVLEGISGLLTNEARETAYLLQKETEMLKVKINNLIQQKSSLALFLEQASLDKKVSIKKINADSTLKKPEQDQKIESQYGQGIFSVFDNITANDSTEIKLEA